MAITVHKNDLPADLNFGDCVAVDTETLGLHLHRNRLCLVQLSAGDGNAHLVQLAQGIVSAPNLQLLMENPNVTKLFHYARFDVTMLKRFLSINVNNIYCTKIASKLTRTWSERHGLKELVREFLGIDLSKQQQTSDWGTDKLTEAQTAYAASDVLHLHALRRHLDRLLQREHRVELAQQCFNFMPVRAELDLNGWSDAEDIFQH